MTIIRHGMTDGANGLPIISRAVVRGDTVYVCGVTPDPVGDIKTQPLLNHFIYVAALNGCEF